MGVTSTDLADQEALETAIQLSLSEQQQNRNAYRGEYSADYRSTTSAHQGSRQEHYRHDDYQSRGNYRDERAYSGDERSYYSDEDRTPRGYEADLAPVPRTFDRQYPYNLTKEDPKEVLHKNYTVSNVDKYRLAQQQQQEYMNQLQQSGALEPHLRHRHHHTEQYEEYSETRNANTGARGAEDLRARAYGHGGAPGAAPPPSYREPPHSQPAAPGGSRAYEGGYPYDQGRQYEDRRRDDDASLSPRSRGNSLDDERYGYDGRRPPYDERDLPPQYGRDDRGPPSQYDRAPPTQYDRDVPHDRAPPPAYGDPRSEAYGRRPSGGYDAYAHEERYEEYSEQRCPPQGAYPTAYPPSSKGGSNGSKYGASPPPAYEHGAGSGSDEDSRHDAPPRFERGAGHTAVAGVARADNTRALNRAPSARDLHSPVDQGERSFTPPAGAVAIPPMVERAQYNQQQAQLQRSVQVTQQTSRSVEYSASREASAAAPQRPAVPARPAQLTAPPSFAPRPALPTSNSTRAAPPSFAPRPALPTSNSLRGPPPPAKGLAAVDEVPPEYAEDDGAAFEKKHEWRKTLKNLVNNLTEDSD
jgi:hypothetical protein